MFFKPALPVPSLTISLLLPSQTKICSFPNTSCFSFSHIIAQIIPSLLLLLTNPYHPSRV